MSDGGTTTKGSFRVGLAKWLGGLALVVLGGINSYGAYNVVTRAPTATHPLLGTNTGHVLQLNGMTVQGYDMIPLTMTGGKANYNLALARLKDYGISGSGVALTAAVAWVKAPNVISTDLAITKCRSGASPNAVSGTLLPNGNNVLSSSGSGLMGVVGTGAVRVNGDDCISVKSLQAPTAAGSGYLIIDVRDDPSE